MSTRAVYTFRDADSEHHVYVHMDGYPDGAAMYFAKTLASGLIWPLPRFEADEFAAGFVAAVKTGGGNVRLTDGPDAHADIEYHYALNDQLWLTAAEVNNWGEESVRHEIYSGPLHQFIAENDRLAKRYAA